MDYLTPKGELTVSPTQAPEFATDREIWEKQPFEDDTAWGLFQTYRNLPPEYRTIWRAWAIFTKQIEPPTPSDPLPDLSEFRREVPYWVNQVAALYRWRERIDAFDRFMDGVILKSLIASRARALFEAAFLGRRLRNIAMKAAQELERSGEKISPGIIARFADLGTRLERESLGLEALAKSGGVGNANLAVTLNVNTREGMENAQVFVSDDDLLDRVRELIEARDELIDGKGEGATR